MFCVLLVRSFVLLAEKSLFRWEEAKKERGEDENLLFFQVETRGEGRTLFLLAHPLFRKKTDLRPSFSHLTLGCCWGGSYGGIKRDAAGRAVTRHIS